MGARLALTLYAEWSLHLTPLEMNAAVRMALTARDDGAPPLYYGGWEDIAEALGYRTPGAEHESVRRQTQRVVTKLGRKGLITSSGQARPRVRAEYALNVDPLHRFEPTGKGKAVTWTRVPRADPRLVESRPSPANGGLPESGMRDSQSPALGDCQSPPKETLQETHQEGQGQRHPAHHAEHDAPDSSDTGREALALYALDLPTPEQLGMGEWSASA
ncbi:hypothetical protein E4A47_09845 [Micrococcus flavus]|uniref:Uncharacterized protein n=1 Tax=Micrococcus flavus TaxID=384602 RepID=A0A4Y8WWY9_9MICC|nr:hypothetical protein [Micrococcus flavus]MBB4883540.1 hypothetical protein [Micrococcus flavus]TFH99702.1 hypothetical protein E4A47_09845 [Micrococcus flavus]GGK54972.1 hypothetical protein GCM10007073_22650 [Micrococcus flavus]